MPTSSPLVARSWSGRATPAGARAYLEHFERAVLPAVRGLAGPRGALVRRRPAGAEIGIAVLTRWASLDGVHAVAGADVSVAVVEPEARAAHLEPALRAEP